MVTEYQPHPGLLAPASLKREMPRDDKPMIMAHPGLLAPASLKHSGEVTCQGFVRDSSGAACPGLIEAPLTRKSGGSGGKLIRGCLPRPH